MYMKGFDSEEDMADGLSGLSGKFGKKLFKIVKKVAPFAIGFGAAGFAMRGAKLAKAAKAAKAVRGAKKAKKVSRIVKAAKRVKKVGRVPNVNNMVSAETGEPIFEAAAGGGFAAAANALFPQVLETAQTVLQYKQANQAADLMSQSPWPQVPDNPTAPAMVIRPGATAATSAAAVDSDESEAMASRVSVMESVSASLQNPAVLIGGAALLGLLLLSRGRR